MPSLLVTDLNPRPQSQGKAPWGRGCLRPPQIRSRYKRIIPFLTKIPFIPVLNLYQTVH